MSSKAQISGSSPWRAAGFGVALATGVVLATAPGCGDSFSSCEDTHTCSPSGGGDASVGGEPSDSGAPNVGGSGAETQCSPTQTQSCYEAEDGTSYGKAPPADQTTCRLGLRSCEAGGSWGPCVGAVAPLADDTCDAGNDANCNGTPNEGCSCEDGDKRACAETAETCPAGEQTCAGAAWGPCEGEVKCDVGQTCAEDGKTCQAAVGSSCTTTADCADATCTTFFVDADKDGYRDDKTPVKFCGATKTGYVSSSQNKADDCDGKNADIHPDAEEICDGVDNDCNGRIDMLDNPSLKLSGNQKTLFTNQRSSQVASSGSLYGLTFASDKTYFATMDQAGALKLQPKQVSTLVAVHPTIAWGGNGFGIFYGEYSAPMYFSLANASTGTLSPGSPVMFQSPGGAFEESGAVRMPDKGWMMVGAGGFHSGKWAYEFFMSGANVASESQTLGMQAQAPDVAVSGNRFGVVYDTDASGTHSLNLSIRDESGSEVVAKVFAGTSSSERKAAIAPRAAGGFGILWSDTTGLTFMEVDAEGVAVAECATPLRRTYADFAPDQMVATKRGYLAVSGANAVVKLQEIIASNSSAGCSWGSELSKVGTGTATDSAHIAGGASGFAVVWDDVSKFNTTPGAVYARTFGPNLCD